MPAARLAGYTFRRDFALRWKAAWLASNERRLRHLLGLKRGGVDLRAALQWTCRYSVLPILFYASRFLRRIIVPASGSIFTASIFVLPAGRGGSGHHHPASDHQPSVVGVVVLLCATIICISSAAACFDLRPAASTFCRACGARKEETPQDPKIRRLIIIPPLFWNEPVPWKIGVEQAR